MCVYITKHAIKLTPEAKSMNIDLYPGLSALSSPTESSRQFLTR